MKKSLGQKIVLSSLAGVVLSALIVGNVVSYIYRDMITTALCGTGVSFEGEDFQNALQMGYELTHDLLEEGTVLLKNDEYTTGKKSLPLTKDVKKVNVFGWASTQKGFLMKAAGSGTTTSNASKEISFLKSLNNFGVEYNTEIIDAYTSFHNTRGYGSSEIYKLYEPSMDFYTDAMMQNAVNFSDTAIIVLARNAGENRGEIPVKQTLVTEKGTETDTTRTTLQTSKYEEALIDMVSEKFQNVILVVNSANNMHLECLRDDRINSAIFVGVTGHQGAVAIPHILWGYKLDENGKEIKVSPSGNLTDTYTYDPRTAPSYANRIHADNHIQYVEDIYMGYKWFETADREGFWDSSFAKTNFGITKGYEDVVQYPFGYGLSYTDFDWAIESVSLEDGSSFDKATSFKIDVSVTNTGNYPGADIVKVFFEPEYHKGGIEKAAANLLDYAKTVVLEPGQSQTVTLEFDAYDMASFDAYDKNNNGVITYELEKGAYKVKLMTDAHNVKNVNFGSNKDASNDGILTYNIPDDGVSYKRDPITKQPVKTRMTGDGAYAGVPIDGSSVGAEKNYLTRSDFASTYPLVHAVTPTGTGDGQYFFNDYYNDMKMPVTDTIGQYGELLLVTKEDGSKASLDDLTGKTGVKLKINEELFNELADYNNPKWEELLNQLSAEEMCNLIETGGYKNGAVESIGKPKCTDFDGPAGINSSNQEYKESKSQWTGYPCETIIASTWSDRLTYCMGLAMGAEAEATNVDGWYAPGVNLHRSPYTARNYEYYSEDAVLSGKLAGNVITGAKTNGLYAYLKHFAVSEPGPNPRTLNTWLTEQNLRENYLKPFEIAVKEGNSNAIMSAFNRIGSVWAGASFPVLTKILREEWGFKGTVVTDYLGTNNGEIGNMNPTQGLLAGNDLCLCPSENPAKLDRNDGKIIHCARMATKNIVYTYIDTYIFAKTHTADDDMFNVEVGIKVQDAVFAWWVPVLIACDVVIVFALAIWVLYIYNINVFTLLTRRKVLANANDELEITDDEINKRVETVEKKKKIIPNNKISLENRVIDLEKKIESILVELKNIKDEIKNS